MNDTIGCLKKTIALVKVAVDSTCKTTLSHRVFGLFPFGYSDNGRTVGDVLSGASVVLQASLDRLGSTQVAALLCVLLLQVMDAQCNQPIDIFQIPYASPHEHARMYMTICVTCIYHSTQ